MESTLSIKQWYPHSTVIAVFEGSAISLTNSFFKIGYAEEPQIICLKSSGPHKDFHKSGPKQSQCPALQYTQGITSYRADLIEFEPLANLPELVLF